jgi:DNA repair protein RecN (Recombination protein N)
MLLSLRLSNFAVIEEAEVAFGPGLTVLTGETGAGKSMLIDALSLLSGARADGETVRGGAEEAVVEGVFERSAAMGARLAELGLPDLGAEVSVRRVVGKNGRGKAHVNGALVAVGVLGRLMHGLLDVAGQHEHFALFDAGRHRDLLDRLGGEWVAQAAQRYRETYASLQALDASLQALGGDDTQVQVRADFLQFQLDEIDRVAPRAGEDAQLETEQRRLRASERLRQLAAQAEELVSTREASAVDLTGRALVAVSDAEKIDAELNGPRERLVAAQAELEEAARGLSRYLSGLEADPGRLTEIDDRLDSLRRLCRKHGAGLDGVLARRGALAEELQTLLHRAEKRELLQKQRLEVLREAAVGAAALTAARKTAADALVEAVGDRLKKLAMARARFAVQIDVQPLGPGGADAIELLFCANVGEPLRPLAKVASGGEASRVMLAIKAALAESDECGCTVFDEADAGVGGAVADVVGRLIKEVSRHRQVLCITHLPQVAAHADAHLKVEKSDARGRTHSRVSILPEGEARTGELARMLSGVEVTREALSAAEALLRSASRAVGRVARARPRKEVRRTA